MMILLLQSYKDNHHVQGYKVNHEQDDSCPKENDVPLADAFAKNHTMVVVALDTDLAV